MNSILIKFQKKISILLIVALGFCATPAKAIFGVGDIVHDPFMMAGMLGQTGAQIAQMIQTYYAIVEMKERMGSLAKVKNWNKILRNWAVKELANVQREVMRDIRKRGARISSETPQNPLFASVIKGRNTLDQMERKFNSGTFLSTAYKKSPYSISAMDKASYTAAVNARNQQKINNSLVIDQQMSAQGSNSTVAVAQTTSAVGPDGTTFNGQASASTNGVNMGNYNPNTGKMYFNGDTTIGSGYDKNALSGGTDSVTPGNNPSASTFDPNNNFDPKAINNDDPNGATGLSTLQDANGDAVNEVPEDADTKRLALIHDALEKMDASKIQELDGAIEYNEKVNEHWKETIEEMDAQDMKGPEPWLKVMTMMHLSDREERGIMLRFQRAQEERAQILDEKIATEQRILQQSYLPAYNDMVNALYTSSVSNLSR